MRIVILGLTITSSWGNGHATTFRGLVRGLAQRGHSVLFLERDKPWYAEHRDLPTLPHGEMQLYAGLDELQQRWAAAIEAADLVMVGSYVPEGVAVGALVQRLATGITAFYDIDTPVTLAALADHACDYLTPELLRGFDLYLSFTGGPILQYLEGTLGAAMARALYCSADPDVHQPDPETDPAWDLGYLGTYSTDRQPTVDALLCQPALAWEAGRFVVAGPQYPSDISWPGNVERIEHLPPGRHRAFYAGQRFTLNVTRADMIRCGYSPSVRLFEAACCGVPIISDWWAGLDAFFHPGEEILIANSATEVLALLHDMTADHRRRVAEAARTRVLAAHTGAHRAAELEAYVTEARQTACSTPRRRARGSAAR